MKRLLIPCVIILLSSVSFAVPDAPSQTWFEGNATLHSSGSRFSINWTQVTNEAISYYIVYVTNALDGNTLLTTTNTSAKGFYFTGTNGFKYIFKISAVNAIGDSGENATTDWIFVDSVPPEITINTGTPEDNAYIKENKITINISTKGSNSNKIIYEHSEDTVTAGSVQHIVRVDAVSDASTAYISLDGGFTQMVSLNNRHTINGVLVYINNIFYGEGANAVDISIAESGLNLVLNWDGVNETGAFAYYGTSWSASKILKSNGAYTYYAWATDSVGNRNITRKRTLNFNPEYQQIILASPKNITYDALWIPIMYAYVNAGTATCLYEYGNENYTLPNCENTNFSALRNTASKLTLWISDSKGDIVSSGVIFTTAIPPAIISSTPANNSVLNPPSLTGINSTNVGAVTDITAECRYSTEKGIDFNFMRRFESTNATVHNTTINISDSSEYKVYIRCKDTSGNANNNDYTIAFATWNGNNKLIVDPDGTIIENGLVALELLEGASKSLSIPVRNTASANIENPNISIAGGGKPYISAKIPGGMIPGNSEVMLDVSVVPTKTGVFESEINMSKGASKTGFVISFTVYTDFMHELNALKDERIALAERLNTLNMQNTDVSSLIMETDRLLANITESISEYNNGNYGNAKQISSVLKTEFASIEQQTFELEEIQKSMEINNGGVEQIIEEEIPTNTENTNLQNDNNENTGNSGNIWIAIGVIFVAVIIIVIATSILPDDYGKKKDDDEETGEQGPYER